MNSWTCESASRIRDVRTGGCVSTSTRKYSQEAVWGVEGVAGRRDGQRRAGGQVGGQAGADGDRSGTGPGHGRARGDSGAGDGHAGHDPCHAVAVDAWSTPAGASAVVVSVMTGGV